MDKILSESIDEYTNGRCSVVTLASKRRSHHHLVFWIFICTRDHFLTHLGVFEMTHNTFVIIARRIYDESHNAAKCGAAHIVLSLQVCHQVHKVKIICIVKTVEVEFHHCSL